MTEAWLQVVLLALGMAWGFILALLAMSYGRSPILERRRWKAIWANERWLKDLQDFHASLEREVQSLRSWLARLTDLHGYKPHVRSFELHYLADEGEE